MNKLLAGVTVVLVLLSGCAGRSSTSDPSDSTQSSSRSGVDFYGTLDIGIGSRHSTD